MTTNGSAPRRKLTALIAAVAVAASLTVTASAPAAAQGAGPFPDTPPDAYYTAAVEALHQQGVFAGTLCDAGFCPDEALDRAAMVVWTVRVVDDQAPAAVTSTRFADVEASHPHAPYIERFAELGITAGCGDGSRFCPQDTVTRAQMAIFLSRAFSLAEGPDPGFADVAADAWYAPSVASLAASGITAGCGDGSRFCPQNTVLRAHMAVFLARALGLLETPDGGGGGGAGSGGGGGGSGGDGGGPTSGDGTANASDVFASISAGNKHACRVLSDKSLECWGDNLERQLNAPHGEFLAVSAGGFHTCAVRADNTVSCWGESKDGQTRRPRIEFMALSSGFRHTCGITASEDDAGLVECWGLDSNGQSTPLGRAVPHGVGRL